MKDYIDEDSSHTARLLMLSYVLLSLIMCGGSVFGFTPLKEILLDEGVYQESCQVGDTSPCEQQLVQLDLMLTLAASLFSAYLMPAGFCLRFLGPRWCFLVGFFFVILGCYGFAWGDSQYFTLSYVLIGTGNPLLYISAFNFGKLYPQSSNLLLSICIGCFGFSSVVFYVFHVFHFHFGWSSQELFFGFSFIPLALGVVGFFVLPPDPYHIQRQKKLDKLQASAAAEDALESETTPLKAAIAANATSSDAVQVPDGEESTIIEVPLVERTILQQLESPQFLAQTLFFCWGMLHQNFYLATIGDQIYMTAGDNVDDRHVASAILTNFSFVYPFGCIIAILPVGVLVKNCSVATSLLAYSVANLVFSSLSLVDNVDVQWMTSSVYILVRVGFFTVMSTYSSSIFGFRNLSTMFGCAGCLAGLTSLLGTFLSHRALNVDHSFGPINTLMLVGALVNFAFPYVVSSKGWQQS